MKTMISFVSRQTWPQVVAVEHFSPKKLVLLHSADERESLNPAKRLEKFLGKSFSCLRKNINLIKIPHESIDGIKEVLGQYADENALINLTGGNKLMTIAGYDWAIKNQVAAFYLERGNLLIDLSGKSTKKLPTNILNRFSALDLIRCQMDGFKISAGGEMLTLNENGKIHKAGRAAVAEKKGDMLEYRSAEILLKLGVPRIHRSIELKGPDMAGLSNRHAVMEIDLLFNWNGSIWIVDCKDKSNRLIPWFEKVTRASTGNEEYEKLKKRLSSELAKTEAKAFKDDLVASSLGGILGKIISVRKVMPAPDIANFAKANGIEILLREDLEQALKTVLFPEKPASADSLKELEEMF